MSATDPSWPPTRAELEEAIDVADAMAAEATIDYQLAAEAYFSAVDRLEAATAARDAAYGRYALERRWAS